MIGRTVRDARCAGSRRWVILQDDEKRLMQVPEEMRDGVVFLYALSGAELVPAGTGFFVMRYVPGHQGRTLAVLMTAHHVIDAIRRHGEDDQVHIRINLRDGGADFFAVPVKMWLHPDKSVDWAMLPWVPRPESKTLWSGWVLDDGVATAAVMRREGIGIGDEVFAVGLFRNHLGEDRNEPILRVGNIAALPADPITTKRYGAMRATLIEIRSIGGLSGSPVFVHMGGFRVREGQPSFEDTDRPFFLLGLIHGHWDAMDTEADADMLGVGEEKINTGIGIVVPAEEMMRVFGPLLDQYVTEAREILDEQSSPAMDTVGQGDEFERFEVLTRKLVQVPKKELDEKRSDG